MSRCLICILKNVLFQVRALRLASAKDCWRFLRRYSTRRSETGRSGAGAQSSFSALKSWNKYIILYLHHDKNGPMSHLYLDKCAIPSSGAPPGQCQGLLEIPTALQCPKIGDRPQRSRSPARFFRT